MAYGNIKLIVLKQLLLIIIFIQGHQESVSGSVGRMMCHRERGEATTSLVTLQMNWVKFKTSGKLLLVSEEYMKCDSRLIKKDTATERSQHVTSWAWKP